MLMLWTLVLLLWAVLIRNSCATFEELSPRSFAIVQFDSRPLANYWLVAAQWNNEYCTRHQHTYIYYNLDGNCHYNGEPLASAWCKVMAMRSALVDYPEVTMFYYMDSDAVIDKAFAHLSLKQISLVIEEKLSWPVEQRPIIFNQDGPCWWCRLVLKIGYSMCLNAGTVVWYRHPGSEKVLREWWDAAMDSYETNPIKRKFRLKWPWEQDRQMAVYNRSTQFIQVASQPERAFMQARAGITNGWCLSHLPEAECYISHYCANSHSKQLMRNLYSTNSTRVIDVRPLHLT